MTTHHSGRWARLCAAGIAACVGALAGCSQQSEGEAALQQARRSMLALHGPGVPPSTDVRRQTQQQVVSLLQGPGSSLEGASASAAASVLAHAQAGLAQIEAERATALQRSALASVASARADLGVAVAQAGLADALERFDPASDIASMRAEAEELSAQLAEARRGRDALDRERASLEARAAELNAQGRERRRAEQDLRAQALDTDPASRPGLVERAFGVRREADALEKQAATVEAEVETVRPRVAVADLEIQRLSRQVELNERAQQRLLEAADRQREQAADARRVGDEAARRFADRVAQLEALRTGDLATALEAALSGYAQAIGTARRASSGIAASDSRAPAAMSAASLQQDLAGVLRGRARFGAVYADLLRAADAAGLRPASGPSYGEIAAALDEESRSALASAAEQFDAARSSLQGSGARGATRDAADRLAGLLPGAPPPEPTDQPTDPAAEPDPDADQPTDPAGEPTPDGAGDPALDPSADPPADAPSR